MIFHYCVNYCLICASLSAAREVGALKHHNSLCLACKAYPFALSSAEHSVTSPQKFLKQLTKKRRAS